MNTQEISKTSINLISEFPNEYRNKILKLAFSSNLPTVQDRSKTIDNFARDTNIPKETILEVLGVYITLLAIFLQTSDYEFSEKLTDIGFTSEFIENLPFLGNREEIIDNLQKSYSIDFRKLSSFKWRIDISLSHSKSFEPLNGDTGASQSKFGTMTGSTQNTLYPPCQQMSHLSNRDVFVRRIIKHYRNYTSVLVKKVPNFVVFSLTMTNGKKYIIELDPRMFHKLRFNIALILNELNSLKSNK